MDAACLLRDGDIELVESFHKLLMMREQLVYMAKLAEQTERFDDMIAHMKKVL